MGNAADVHWDDEADSEITKPRAEDDQLKSGAAVSNALELEVGKTKVAD
jgi:hypothetical protein